MQWLEALAPGDLLAQLLVAEVLGLVFECPDPVGAIVGLQQLVQRQLHLGRQRFIEQLSDPLAFAGDGAADQVLQVRVAGRDGAPVRQML